MEPNKSGGETPLPAQLKLETIETLLGNESPMRKLEEGTGLNVELYLYELQEDIRFLAKKYPDKPYHLSHKFPGRDGFRNEVAILTLLNKVAPFVDYDGVAGNEIIPMYLGSHEGLKPGTSKIERIICETYFGSRKLYDLFQDLELRGKLTPKGSSRMNLGNSLVDSLVLMSLIGDRAIEEHKPELEQIDALTIHGSDLAEKIESYFMGTFLSLGDRKESAVDKQDLSTLRGAFRELEDLLIGKSVEGKEHLTTITSNDPRADNIMYYKGENGNGANKENGDRPSFRYFKHIDFSHSMEGPAATDLYLFNDPRLGFNPNSIRYFIQLFWFNRLKAKNHVGVEKISRWRDVPQELKDEIMARTSLAFVKESLRQSGLEYWFEKNRREQHNTYYKRAYMARTPDQVRTKQNLFYYKHFDVLRRSMIAFFHPGQQLYDNISQLSLVLNSPQREALIDINNLLAKYLPFEEHLGGGYRLEKISK